MGDGEDRDFGREYGTGIKQSCNDQARLEPMEGGSMMQRAAILAVQKKRWTKKDPHSFLSSQQVDGACDLGLQGFELLRVLDADLIQPDRLASRVGRLVGDKADFRLADGDMGRVCGTDRVQCTLPTRVALFCRDSFILR